ncbi:helix-turn-helix domain-containing protein [Kutzneria chonburiensis]|uniref:Helix-turn-helix domain-containing protein n=1 Tax=Kutzneria chonburiensis TaxID=1483604 RepID=A0ABV6MQZ6_9PSEU|nr:helix-turn-helix transcriptional regulator [Kutzneria chonburiensis]
MSVDTAASRLASHLRQLRKQTGRSLKDLEAELHVSDSSLSRYFSGQSAPPWPVVEQLGRLAGQDVAELRGLWQEAGQRRRATEPEPDPEPAPQPEKPRSRRWLLAGAFVLTAVVFGGLGLYAGVRIGQSKPPAEDAACASWPWPGGNGEDVVPFVSLNATEHKPTVELIIGKGDDGRSAAWAKISGAKFGDRVWLDWSSDGGRSWVQCGPFPVSAESGTSRAHDTGPNWLFRACGDVPQPIRRTGGEGCTDYH